MPEGPEILSYVLYFRKLFLGKKLEESLDVKELVRNKVEAFSSDKLEQILFSIMSDWGRIVNIFYTFSILSFIHLFKNKLVIIE